jgi:hypothetical protein
LTTAATVLIAVLPPIVIVTVAIKPDSPADDNGFDKIVRRYPFGRRAKSD